MAGGDLGDRGADAAGEEALGIGGDHQILSGHHIEVVTVAECFVSVEAHAAHHKTPWFEAMWGDINRRCRHGRFENIFPGRVEPDSVDFDDKDQGPVT